MCVCVLQGGGVGSQSLEKTMLQLQHGLFSFLYFGEFCFCLSQQLAIRLTEVCPKAL